MKKLLALALTMVMLFSILTTTSTSVFAGVTDTDGGNIVRKTTTNYYTSVTAKATATNSVTGEMVTFEVPHSDELVGNISDENVAAVIDDYRARINVWAESLGVIEKIEIEEGVSNYYYDVHDEISESKTKTGGSDVILVGDMDDIDAGYVAQGTLTVETILNKHQTYELVGTITFAPKKANDIIPAFADEQMVTVGKGDFETPHYFDLTKGTFATGDVTDYQIGGEIYHSDEELKAFLAAQPVGAVIDCDFVFSGSGDYADFSDSGRLSFTMAAAVDTISVTITEPKSGSELATSAIVDGSGGGVMVNEDCLPIESIEWSPMHYYAVPETTYTVEITVKADRGVAFADTVSAKVNGTEASCEVSEESVTVTYTFPKTEADASENNVIKEANITLLGPVTGKNAENEKPNISLPLDANYTIDSAIWVTGIYSEAGDAFEDPFKGTFEADTYYYAEIFISAKEGYTLDSNLLIKVNDEAPAEVFAVFGGTDTHFIAKVKSIAAEEEEEKSEYKVVEGANSVWKQGSEDLRFSSNGDYSKFINVKVDGTIIAQNNYIGSSGSTIINLKADYLNTLLEGEHTLTIVYTDGEASTTFTVQKTAATTGQNTTKQNSTQAPQTQQSSQTGTNAASPKTGDESSLMFWVALLLTSLCGCIGVLFLGRQTEESK